MNQMDHNELLGRYFSGEASPDERARVEAWRRASTENQRVFAELEKIWQNAAAEQLPPVPDIDHSWMELSAKLDLPQEGRPAKILELKKPPQSALRRFAWSDRYVWAAAAVLVLGFATLLYQFLQNANEFKTVTTAFAQLESVQLPDGSVIKLNSDSEIQFPRQFADSARYVTLSGEAYFEVIHDNRPFFVNTGNAQIEVLGTKFGIWARDEKTRVTVREGRVALRPADSPREAVVELIQNQASICTKDNPPAPPRTIDADYSLGWLEGRIVFDQTPLAEVIHELQRVYDVHIELSNPALGQQTITGSFQKKPIASVLASICLALNLRYAEREGRYVISE